jgi:hypothetical protein
VALLFYKTSFNQIALHTRIKTTIQVSKRNRARGEPVSILQSVQELSRPLILRHGNLSRTKSPFTLPFTVFATLSLSLPSQVIGAVLIKGTVHNKVHKKTCLCNWCGKLYESLPFLERNCKGRTRLYYLLFYELTSSRMLLERDTASYHLFCRVPNSYAYLACVVLNTVVGKQNSTSVVHVVVTMFLQFFILPCSPFLCNLHASGNFFS